MRIATIMLTAAATLMVAGSALAADVTDVSFIQASRCRGIASVTAAGTTDLDSWLKAASRSRDSSVIAKAANAQDAGRREVKTTNAERKARLAVELSGPCQAFKG